MKKIFITLAAAALMTACNNQAPKMDAQPADAGDAVQGLRIAYVDVDSVSNQFQYAKDMKEELEKKALNARNTLSRKDNELKAEQRTFEQKYQNNGFTSQEQAQNAYAALQRKANDLATLQARLENELASEQAKFLQALHDSLTNFINIYNVDKKYDMIINKAAVLHADDRHDITVDVINGLNKRYKPTAAKKEAAKKDGNKKDAEAKK